MVHVNITDLYFLIALIISGAIAGYLAGLFGIGGGIILVPTFITILPYFGASPNNIIHIAVATSLALLIPAAIMSSIKQHKMGSLILHHFKRWIPSVLVGIIIGSLLIKYIPAHLLSLLFTILLYLCAILVILKRDSSIENNQAPTGPIKHIVGTSIGCLATLLGIGGGVFTVPYHRLSNYPLKNAIAISSITGLFVGLGGTIANIISGWGQIGRPAFSLGYVNLIAFLIILPLVMYTAPLGSKTSNLIPKNKLKWIYTLFLFAMAAYMTVKTI